VFDHYRQLKNVVNDDQPDLASVPIFQDGFTTRRHVISISDTILSMRGVSGSGSSEHHALHLQANQRNNRELRDQDTSRLKSGSVAGRLSLAACTAASGNEPAASVFILVFPQFSG
jgi:hypothetical protein